MTSFLLTRSGEASTKRKIVHARKITTKLSVPYQYEESVGNETRTNFR